MTDRDPIREYVAELRAEVGVRRLRRRLVGEVESHLREAVAARVSAGVAADRAVAETIASFGEPGEIAAALEREIPARRTRAVLLAAAGTASAAAVALILGVALWPVAGSSELQSLRAHDPASGRVAAALRLTPRAADILATAQRLGRRAGACLLRNGGRPDPAGGVADPSGQARAACLPLVEANDRYLEGSAFRRVLAEARPRLDAAETCVASIVRRGDAVSARPRSPASGATRGKCHGPDGLPA